MRFAALLLALFTVSAAAQTRVMPADKEALLRSVIPPVADPVLASRLASPNLFLYTDEEMPAAYQGNGRFILVRRGVANDGNHRFPWAKPGGLQRVRGVGGFRFISLPETEDGKLKPIVYFLDKLDKTMDRNNSLVWMFPVGTIVGEVFTQTGPDGLDYAWELRTRTREFDDWDAEAYRPFPTAVSLIDGIKAMRPEWDTEPNTRQAVDSLASLRDLKVLTLADSQNATRIFRSAAAAYPLPKLEPKLVNDLLMNATFESTAGLPFAEGSNKVAAVAPTNAQGWNIVPVNFDGAFVGNERRSCMECHETFGMNQRRVDRTWVGGRGEELHFKGSDGIGSFRPTTNVFNGSTPTIRPELLAGGVVARYNPEVHDPETYHPISKLRFEK